MRVDVPGLPEARVSRLTPARCSSIPPTTCGSTFRTASARRPPARAFATSSGDILDVECFGEGIVPAAPRTEHAAGLRHRRRRARSDCTVAQRLPGVWTFTAGDSRARDQRLAAAHQAVVEGRAGAARRSPTSIFAAGRGCRRSAACGRAACGPPRSRSRRASRFTASARNSAPLDKRGQLIHSQVEDALGVNTGLAYKNTPFAWSPGTGKGAWGAFIHTPGMVTHGVGHPGLVASQLRGDGRGRGARPVPVRRGHARRDHRPLHATDRTAGAGAAVESRAVGFARALPDAGRRDRRRGEAARAQDPVPTC